MTRRERRFTVNKRSQPAWPDSRPAGLEAKGSMTQAPHHLTRRVYSYVSHRLRNPQAILDLLRDECRLSSKQKIADIGSGTGLPAELFLEKGG